MASGSGRLLRLDFCGVDWAHMEWPSAGDMILQDLKLFQKNYFKEYNFYDDTGASGVSGKNSEFNGHE